MSCTARQKFIWMACFLGFFAIFSTSVSKNPVLPLYAGTLGAGDTLIGCISAASPLAGVLLSFPLGFLSDKLGRRGLIRFSGLILILAPLLYLFVSDPLWLIPVRFLHGTATATLSPVISSAIAERFGSQKGLLMGTYSSATLMGRTAAPLIGGAILTLFAFLPGTGAYHLVYLIAFSAGIPAFILALCYREDPHHQGTIAALSPRDLITSFLSLLKNKNLRRACVSQTATYFCFGSFETFLPLYLLSFGVPAWLTGLIFGLQVLVLAVTKPWFGRHADTGRPLLQISAGLFITGLAIAAVPFTQSIPVLIAVSILFGIGMSLSTIAANVYAADAAQKNQTGASLGALASLMDIGHSSGPLICGILVAAGGWIAGFITCGVLAFLTAGYVLTGNRN